MSVQRIKIGVMGSSTAQLNASERELLRLANDLGQAIAERDCILITGATTGIPDIVSRAARRSGGLAIGISPAVSKSEHLSRYLLPDDGVDVIIYTGFGLKGRNVINVRASDIVIIFGGGMGTLNEFTIAYDEGKTIGVLEGTGGAADKIRDIVSFSSKRNDSKIIFGSDPISLIEDCLSARVRTSEGFDRDRC